MFHDYSLNDSFELHGEWYLPESPDRQVAGTLSYEAGRIELRLNGSLTPGLPDPASLLASPRYDAVYGTSTKGEAVTLLEAVRAEISFSGSSGGLRMPEKVRGRLMMIGGFFDPSTKFEQLSFRIPGLQAWYSRPAIERSVGEDRRFPTFKIRSFDDQDTPVSTEDATIIWSSGCRESRSNVFSSISVDIDGWVRFRPAVPRPLMWHFEQQLKLTTMLSLLAGASMPPDQIAASFGDRRRAFVFAELTHSEPCSYSSTHEFLLPLNAIQVGLETLVDQWFRVFPQLGDAVNLAMSVLASEGKLWVHVEFLSFMHALEGFHRALHAGTYMDAEEYKSVAKAIAGAIPSSLEPGHLEALKARLKFGNEISLRRRLNDLADRLRSPLREAILGENGRVPSRWVDTRNFYTHWTADLSESALRGAELHECNIRLSHFVRVLYLDLMGVPQAAISEALQNSSEASQLLRQLNGR